MASVTDEDENTVTIEIEIDPDQAWFWTQAWQAGEREASADIANGRVQRSYSDEEFLAALDED